MVDFPEERTYSNIVKVGNWFEDRLVQDDKIREFLIKREKGELLMQKQELLSSTVLAPMPIDVSRDGLVHFGDTVVIKHSGFSDREPHRSCLLTVQLGSNLLHNVPSSLPSGETVSAAPNLQPNVRSTFVIKELKDSSVCGKPLTFGEYFEICTTDGFGGNLKLYSARRNFVEFSKRTTGQLVLVVSESSRQTRWRILCLNPNEQMEVEGYAVPSNHKILLNHVATNQNLALEWSTLFPGFQGAEYEATTHSYFLGNRTPMEANHWMICMQPREMARFETLAQTPTTPEPAKRPLQNFDSDMINLDDETMNNSNAQALAESMSNLKLQETDYEDNFRARTDKPLDLCKIDHLINK